MSEVSSKDDAEIVVINKEKESEDEKSKGESSPIIIETDTQKN